MAHVPLDAEPKGIVPKLARSYTRRRFGQIVEPTQAASHHAGVLVAMGDASVQFIAESIDLSVWQAMGTLSGNEMSVVQ